MTKTFYVNSGDSEYVGAAVEELTGKDISLDVVKLSIGSASRAGEWVTPDLIVTDGSKITAKLKLNDTMPKGVQHLYIRIEDTPETIVRWVAEIILV